MNYRRRCLFMLTVIAGVLQSSAQAERVPQWPLRNGDFSIITGPVTEPMPQAYWQVSIDSGEHAFTVAPQPKTPSFDADAPPSTAIITTSKAGRGQWFQDFPLEKGRYRVTVQFSGSVGSKAEIGFKAGSIRSVKAVTPSAVSQLVTLEVDAPGGKATISLSSLTTGVVEFRDVVVQAIKLDTSALPTLNTAPIGGVVLPATPSPAEKYACYQLQHFINRMTGLTPGLKGRDPIYPGRLIYIGRSAPNSLKALKGLSSDAYLVGSTGKELIMAGNSDEATLYAVFDFLKQQGCRWITPGVQGEVIPRRSKLLYSPLRKEVPEFDVRGGLVSYVNFTIYGDQRIVSVDDHLDWALRNRQNAVWLAYGKTSDMGAHRGHGWIQGMNHSFNLTIAPGDVYFKDHPDWYPLIKGVRMAKDANNNPTQLCVSSQGLRDYTVALALKYFKENPNSKIFSMNPNDGVSPWCECAQCKALDAPGIDWSTNGIECLYMTDRVLDYANYVARAIAKAYPGRMVAIYGYGSTATAPAKTKLEKNILIHYCQAGSPLNKPFLYDAVPNASVKFRQSLDGWKKAGAEKFIYYNYLDWHHQDAPIFWSNQLVQTLRGLKEHYNFMGRIGETETSHESSPAFYAVMSGADWNTHIDYKAVIKDTCDKFYGKAAATMYRYNMMMDDAVMASNEWQKKDWMANNQFEFSMDFLEAGRKVLEEADSQVRGDALLEKRVAQARFSHAYLTYARALNERKRTAATDGQGRLAFEQANELRKEYKVRTWWPTFLDLQILHIEPIAGDGTHVQDLPIEWKFKTDPKNEGLDAGWFNQQPDDSWGPIRTDESWTTQGHDFHGAAWYSTTFALRAEAGDTPSAKLALHFNAVDGYCDIYLDGQKIGEQKQDINTMWNQPFRIDLPAKLSTGLQHRLVIRVQKDTFAAGIWKKVSIVKTSIQP